MPFLPAGTSAVALSHSSIDRYDGRAPTTVDPVVWTITEFNLTILFMNYSNPPTVDVRDSFMASIEMLEELTVMMADDGDGIIAVPDLTADYMKRVSLYVDNNIKPATVTCRMLVRILVGLGHFLRTHTMKLTQFWVLDSGHGMEKLLYGTLEPFTGKNDRHIMAPNTPGGETE
ncbi:MAG: hypothetical protein Q9163_005167 [Psora crenata]